MTCCTSIEGPTNAYSLRHCRLQLLSQISRRAPKCTHTRNHASSRSAKRRATHMCKKCQCRRTLTSAGPAASSSTTMLWCAKMRFPHAQARNVPHPLKFCTVVQPEQLGRLGLEIPDTRDIENAALRNKLLLGAMRSASRVNSARLLSHNSPGTPQSG